MANKEHARTVPARPEVWKHSPDAGDCLAPTLPTGMRGIQIPLAIAVNVDCWLAIQRTVVALSQPPISEHGYRGRSESDSSCLDGASKIGCEDRLQSVMTTARAKLGSEKATAL